MTAEAQSALIADREDVSNEEREKMRANIMNGFITNNIFSDPIAVSEVKSKGRELYNGLLNLCNENCGRAVYSAMLNFRGVIEVLSAPRGMMK
jgi:hypothetical protein